VLRRACAVQDAGVVQTTSRLPSTRAIANCGWVSDPAALQKRAASSDRHVLMWSMRAEEERRGH